MWRALCMALLPAGSSAFRQNVPEAAWTSCAPDKDWALEWADEFDGSSLNSDWWQTVSSTDEDASQEKAPVGSLGATACRRAKCTSQNVYVQGGYLQMVSEESQGNYTTGAVTTHGKLTWRDDVPYRLCVRAKLPRGGQGVWPAHWMLPENGIYDQCLQDGEVDITEMVNADGKVHSTYHWLTGARNVRCKNFSQYHRSKASETSLPPSWSETFHEFAVERSSEYISFFVDGQETLTLSSEETGVELSHSPFFLILNTAIGGEWPGEPSPQTQLPTTHFIDFVRVLRRRRQTQSRLKGTSQRPGPATGNLQGRKKSARKLSPLTVSSPKKDIGAQQVGGL